MAALIESTESTHFVLVSGWGLVAINLFLYILDIILSYHLS